MQSEVPGRSNILGGRLLLPIRDQGTGQGIWKTRFKVQGHEEVMKSSTVHIISVARQHVIKMLVGIAAIFLFRIFSAYVTQAYLQISKKLHRDVFIKLTAEFNLHSDELFKILKPLHGLSESVAYWGVTLRGHLEDYFCPQSYMSDAALFFKQLGT